MADHIDAGNDIFVYMGGDQHVPLHVTHASIHPSVKIVRAMAFYDCEHLVSVIFHDGVEILEQNAFGGCTSLRGGIKLLGVTMIDICAFFGCYALSDVEFGDELETIGESAFQECNSLRSIKMPTVRTIMDWSFDHCEQLTDVEFGVNLERIACNSFYLCPNLRRITIPLKDNMFPVDPDEQQYNQFDRCDNLATVDLVGAESIHRTVSSLLLETWSDDINEEIGRINQELPNTAIRDKSNAIRLWIRSVIDIMEYYKAEHNLLLKEHMTQLELAVWKVNLDEKEENFSLQMQTKRVKIDVESMRKEKRITSGASIVIKNVLPFLKLDSGNTSDTR